MRFLLFITCLLILNFTKLNAIKSKISTKSATPVAKTADNDGWIKGDFRKYKFYKAEVTFKEAINFCKTRNSYLAAATMPVHVDAMTKAINDVVDAKHTWIGLEKKIDDNNGVSWKWVDNSYSEKTLHNEDTTLAKWYRAANYPAGYTGNCVALLTGSQDSNQQPVSKENRGKWINRDCNKKYNVLCFKRIERTLLLPSPKPWFNTTIMELIGCYKVDASKFEHKTTNDMTNLEFCRDWCTDKNYLYLAVTAGNICSCTNKIKKLVKSKVAPKKCAAVSCGGNPRQRCGGNDGEYLVFRITTKRRTKSADLEASEVCVPVEGGWSTWQEWQTCRGNYFAHCGNGTRVRYRTCSKPYPRCSGKVCNSYDKKSTDKCQLAPCPRAGNWNVWSCWKACDCDKNGDPSLGLRNRTRVCDHPKPEQGGRGCIGSCSESELCSCAVDGKWGPWAQWTKCTSTCGGGIKTRKRKCNDPEPMNGGLRCPGEDAVVESCNKHNCPVTGEWCSWQSWGSCSSSCNQGIEERFRKCECPNPRGGHYCVGERSAARNCLVKHCPGHGLEWSAWTPCFKNGNTPYCEQGIMERVRTCISLDGKNKLTKLTNCKPKEKKPCKLKPCAVHGQWGAWFRATACIRTKCGVSGRITIKRRCDSPSPSAGGKDCEGKAIKYKSCRSKPCRVDGKWSEWGSYSKCQGDPCYETPVKSRRRSCSKPRARYGGKPCRGKPYEQKDCKMPCKGDGGWSEWDMWTDCLPDAGFCGAGKKKRIRYCDNPAPVGFGKTCQGSDVEYQDCMSAVKCPKNGQWSLWTSWEECNYQTCTVGIKERTRTCSNPKPAFGGDDCVGKRRDSNWCKIKKPAQYKVCKKFDENGIAKLLGK